MWPMCADYASPFEILGCILAAESARVCQQGADDVDGIRLKTGGEPSRLGLRGLVQARGNFFIREALSDQMHCAALHWR